MTYIATYAVIIHAIITYAKYYETLEPPYGTVSQQYLNVGIKIDDVMTLSYTNY